MLETALKASGRKGVDCYSSGGGVQAVELVSSEQAQTAHDPAKDPVKTTTSIGLP